MATKPTNVPRWANVGGSIVEPASGKKDVGFETGERPAAQYFNWLLNLIYQWIDWLDDGDVSFNTMTVASHVTMTSGNLTVSAGNVAITAGDLTVGDDATITGDLTVTGEVYHASTQRINYGYGEGRAAVGTWTETYATGTTPSYVNPTGAGDVWRIPLSGLRVGDKLQSYGLNWYYAGDANTFTVRLKSQLATGGFVASGGPAPTVTVHETFDAHTQIGSPGAGDTGYQGSSLAVSPVVTVANDTSYWLEIEANTDTDDRVLGAWVTITRTA